MAKRRSPKKADPITASLALRKRAKFFLRNGARNEAEAEFMAKRELFEKSLGHVEKRRKRPDLTGASYLDQFGVECARKIAPEIRQAARGFGLSLPLDDLRVNHYLTRTIRVMDGAEKLDWAHTPTDRQTVFLMSMFTELQRQGIAE